MALRFLGGKISLKPLVMRMPFRYGIATMTEVEQAVVEVSIETNGREARGFSSDILPPKWFTKIAEKNLTEETREMNAVIHHALEEAAKIGEAENPFEFWRELYQRQMIWAGEKKLPPLLANFGTSLLERALLEGWLRAGNHTLFQGLSSVELGVVLDKIHPELTEPAASYLPPTPLEQVLVRHTVGLADYLTDSEIPPVEVLRDGLPQSLEACIQRYRLRHFKIKLLGNLEPDLERLRRLSMIFEKLCPVDFAFSLDGNEFFRSLAAFQSYWEGLKSPDWMCSLLEHLLFVEQPMHREVALDSASRLIEWPKRPAIIIDESDGSLEDLPRALELGYHGASHKNCKGIFKGLANKCLLVHRERITEGEQGYLMTGEDLCNIGPVSLLQDLAMMSALGIESVERNGHHYAAGLSMYSPEIQAEALKHHPDIYQVSNGGWPTLKIEEGRLHIGSLLKNPFGIGFQPR